jgi:large subunit ribosomal protein L23
MSALDSRSILRRPTITEKSTEGFEKKRPVYTFQVEPSANKHQIKKAVEDIYNVKVVKVNTRRRRGKFKRMGWVTGFTKSKKEAIITLREGDKIDVY